MTDADRDEAELWAMARDGDAEAFASVFDLHRDRVFGHALRLVGSWPDAEDVAASAFLELFRRRRDVRLVNGSALPWLLVTASNLARNSARARRRYRDFLARLPHSGEPPAAAADPSVELDPELIEALRALPEQDVALLSLVALGDLAVADAAAALGLSAGAARTRLHRARQRVRRALPEAWLPFEQDGGPE